MSDDERKFIHLYVTHIEFKHQNNGFGLAQASCTLVGDFPNEAGWDWEIFQKRIKEGWKVYETEGLIHEALAAVQADLEKEKLRYADLERSKSDAIAELGQKLSLQQAELERLRALEATLNHIARWGSPPGGKIGP